LQRIFNVHATLLIVEKSTFSIVQIGYLKKILLNFGKDIIKNQRGCFCETPCICEWKLPSCIFSMSKWRDKLYRWTRLQSSHNTPQYTDHMKWLWYTHKVTMIH